MTKPRSWRTDRTTLAALAGLGLPTATLSLPLVVYLPEFYSNALGLKVALVGAIFSGIRLVDIGVDPILGALMDRTSTRWGRYRPWLALGAPLIMLAVAMLFMAHRGVGPAYLTIWLLVVYFGWSVLTLAQLALSAELSPDYDERSRIYGWVQAVALCGVLIVLLAPRALKADSADPYATMRVMAWVTIILAPLTSVFALLRLNRSVAPAERQSTGLREYVLLFRNRTVLRLLIADVLLGLGLGTTSAGQIFYFTRVLDLPRGAVSLNIIGFMMAAFLAAPVWTRVAQRAGKHRALLASIVVYIAATSLYLVLPHGRVWMVIMVGGAAGICYPAFVMLPRSMMADAGDEEMLRTGANRSALLYSLLLGTWKVGQALSIGIVFGALGLIGFVPSQVGALPFSTVIGLACVVVVGPCLFAAAAFYVMLGYKLTASRHAQIRRALEMQSKEGLLF